MRNSPSGFSLPISGPLCSGLPQLLSIPLPAIALVLLLLRLLFLRMQLCHVLPLSVVVEDRRHWLATGLWKCGLSLRDDVLIANLSTVSAERRRGRAAVRALDIVTEWRSIGMIPVVSALWAEVLQIPGCLGHSLLLQVIQHLRLDVFLYEFSEFIVHGGVGLRVEIFEDTRVMDDNVFLVRLAVVVRVRLLASLERTSREFYGWIAFLDS